MKDATAIAVVVDKSGSMHPRRHDVIGGFNEFVDSQKKLPGEATLTLVMFNHQYEVVYTDKDIQKVNHFTEDDYYPGGNTALLDAVGTCIDTLGQKLSEVSEEKRPDKVIVVIMTDGEENSSREYSLDTIKEKIEHQKDKYKWEFMFVGAGIDAFEGARRLGISYDMAMGVPNSSKGVRAAYHSVAQGVSRYRSSGSVGSIGSDSTDSDD